SAVAPAMGDVAGGVSTMETSAPSAALAAGGFNRPTPATPTSAVTTPARARVRPVRWLLPLTTTPSAVRLNRVPPSRYPAVRSQQWAVRPAQSPRSSIRRAGAVARYRPASEIPVPGGPGNEMGGDN